MKNQDYNFAYEARYSFRAFFAIATADDAMWMDTLILAWAALTKGICIPRDFIPLAERADLERACDEAERRFMQARDRVRASTTFCELAPADQTQIASVLFELDSLTAGGASE